jgi:membrane-anchored protein YejM (alkaline phosphatase superfamily)
MFNDKEDKQEMLEELEEELDDNEFFQTARFKVTEVADFSSDDLEYIKYALENYYDVDLDDITDYKKVMVEITSEGESDKTQLVVIKYKGEWKLFIG